MTTPGHDNAEPAPVLDLFPKGRYYALLGEIAENYGGMTSVVMHRSRAMANAGIPVDILTSGPGVDYVALARQMKADGRIVQGMSLRNMYDELRTTDPERFVEPGTECHTDGFTPLDEPGSYSEVLRSDVLVQRVKHAQNGTTVLQIDHLRPDGTLFMLERRDYTTPQGQPGQVVYLCDNAGQPVRRFSTVDKVRYLWLDLVFGNDPSFVFSDSRRVARYIAHYHRTNVVVIQSLHTNHLPGVASRLVGEIEPSHRALVRSAGHFAALVLLTERHKQDFEALVGASASFHVVPNSREITPSSPGSGRPPLRGIMLSRLTQEKRVNHAISTIADVRDRHALPAQLMVYGEGPRRAELERQIRDLDISSAVNLAGYTPDARLRFSDASFSLLTSKSEAFSLVLVESMAAGCIPIAYDVKYGPREIITHGVDGFLVDPGDIAGAADVIASLAEMPEADLSRMRAAAARRAADFTDAAVLRRWAEVLQLAKLGRRIRTSDATCTAQSVTVDAGDAVLGLRLQGANWRYRHLSGRVVAVSRDRRVIAGREVAFSRDEGEWIGSCTIPSTLLSWDKKTILDYFLEVSAGPYFSEIRIKLTNSPSILELPRVGDATQFYATQFDGLSSRHSPSGPR